MTAASRQERMSASTTAAVLAELAQRNPLLSPTQAGADRPSGNGLPGSPNIRQPADRASKQARTRAHGYRGEAR